MEKISEIVESRGQILIPRNQKNSVNEVNKICNKIKMRLRHFILYFLMAVLVAPAVAQSSAGETWGRF